MKPGRSAATNLCHFRALALVQRHVFDGFRQVHDGGERDDDRCDAADLKQGLPAILGYEERADDTAERAAHRHAPHGDDRQRGAQIARRRLGADRHQIWNDAADAEAGNQPQPEELRKVGRISGDEREDAEQKVGADQSRLAAVAVPDPAENRRAEQDADIACAQHRAERTARDAPGGDEVRRGKRDGGDVVAIDQRQQDRPEQQSDLECAQSALVEQPRNLDFRRARHRFPRNSLAALFLPAVAAASRVPGAYV